VIPGYSAKCSAKWLSGISVRDLDCDHGKHKAYYKLFPASMKPGTDEYKLHHQDPEYTLGELNVNSCIFQPHSCTSAGPPGPLTVTGYAHTGGGRALSRIEVSGNGGKTWEQVRPLEQALTETGLLWAWVRFSHVLSHFDPQAPDAELVVRAWDCAANTQPDRPQWNYTGMLNNHLYRVAVKPAASNKLVFVHPAQWMDPEFVPFAVDHVPSKPVAYDENSCTQLIQGSWRIGSFENSIVSLDVNQKDGIVRSKEARWGGHRLEAEICLGTEGELELETTLFGFAIRAILCEADGRFCLRWRNGMLWEKDLECECVPNGHAKLPSNETDKPLTLFSRQTSIDSTATVSTTSSTTHAA